MEEAIGKSFDKRINARKDARRVMELFLARSLKEHPDFTPGGHFETVVKDTIKVSLILHSRYLRELPTLDIFGPSVCLITIPLSESHSTKNVLHTCNKRFKSVDMLCSK